MSNPKLIFGAILGLMLVLALVGLVSNGAVQAVSPPAASIAAPAQAIGDLGAASGNVWNMDSLGDVVWAQPNASNQTVQYSVQAGVSGAYGSVLRGEAPQGSDLVSAFYADGDTSIASDTYHHLLYRAYVDVWHPGEAGMQVTNGRIIYSAGWGTDWIQEALPFRRVSKPYELCGYGQWCLYYFDLTDASLEDSTSPNPWDWGQAGARVELFGIWPHENWADSNFSPSGDTPDFFYLDFVYLTGDIVATSPDYNYNVRWNVTDPDGGTITSTLYYQEQDELLLPAQSPACNAGNLATDWTAIPGGTQTLNLSALSNTIYLPLVVSSGGSTGSGGVGPFNQSFTWDLSSLTTGKSYYVCVVVEDGDGNKSYQSSSAPVIKAPASPL
ncbi:MAG: hypothetical protein ACE5H9_12040 [Anaerolineae bacterium]